MPGRSSRDKGNRIEHFRLFIADPPESLNTLNRWRYAQQHWRTEKCQQSWAVQIVSQMCGANYHPKLKRPINIRLTLYLIKIRDQDNLIGGCKYFIDTLTRLDIIPDDDPKTITVQYNQEKKLPGTKPWMLVEIAGPTRINGD